MNKWSTRLLIVLLTGLLPAAVWGGPSAGQIERNIRKAVEMTFSHPDESARLFEASLRQALDLGRPKASKYTQELSLALACKCLHPSLFPEVRVVADAYLEKYPQGRFRKQVMVQKALLEYAEGRTQEAEQLLTAAAPLFKGQELNKLRTLQMNGLFQVGKYQSGGAVLDQWHTQQANRTTRRNVKRWAREDKQVVTALAKSQEGDLDAFGAARHLREAVETGYFTRQAPEAALGEIQAKDAQAPRHHGQDVTWLGMTRTAWHSLPAFVRAEKYRRLLADFPEADPVLRGNVLLKLWLVNRYELDRPTEADRCLARLAEVPSFEGIARLEKALYELTVTPLTSDEGQALVRKIDEHKALFPYDNDLLPVITPDFTNELRLLTELLAGNTDRLGERLGRFTSTWKFHTIPVDLFYQVAVDRRLEAWRAYKDALPAMAARDRRLAKDFLFPLYRPTTPNERQLLAAFAAAEKFPHLAIDRLLATLALLPPARPVQVNHALALLAELYQKNRDYIEAQSVWATLRNLYPSSVWIR
ncbi:MAG: hypothetical protein GX442_04240 [Candidatus Riflebacteria bacterium]|nr:hypothetical protein [Candidatus Riflebacteria bacterium]